MVLRRAQRSHMPDDTGLLRYAEFVSHCGGVDPNLERGQVNPTMHDPPSRMFVPTRTKERQGGFVTRGNFTRCVPVYPRSHRLDIQPPAHASTPVHGGGATMTVYDPRRHTCMMCQARDVP